MSILSTNLKLYFRHRFFIPLLILHFAFLSGSLYLLLKFCTIAPGTQKSPSLNFIFFGFIAMLLLGDTIAGIQRDILSKPFSFCLPDHNKIPRQIIFIIGSVVILTYSLVFAFILRPTTLEDFANVLFVPAILLPFYSLTVYFSFSLQKKLPNVLIFIFILSIIPLKYIRPSAFNLIFYYILPLSFFSLPFLVKVWKTLVDPDKKRRYICEKTAFRPIILTVLAKMREVEKLNRQYPKAGIKNYGFETFFMLRMSQSPFLSIKRSTWGMFYESIDGRGWIKRFSSEYFSASKSIILITIVSSFLICFVSIVSKPLTLGNDGRYHASVLFIFYLCIGITSIFSPVGHNLLLPIGRRERFSISIILNFGKLLLEVIWIGVILTISWGIWNFLTEFITRLQSLTYYPFDWNIVRWLCVLIPILDIGQFLFNRSNSIAVFILLVLINILYLHFNNVILNTSTIILIAFILCGFLLCILAYHYFRRDLLSSPV